nr:AMP-binding protein [Caballeronia sp. INDeC2]
MTKALRQGDISIASRALETFDCDFYQGFGGGEMGGLVSYLMPDDHRAEGKAKRLSSVGRPANYAQICIRDLKDGAPLPANEPGEITVCSPSNFSGYLSRPDETAKTLRGEWVYTADVGYLDEDGYLYAVDRAKDMVVIGGMNVSSAEAEAVLAEHPAVKSVAVIGLPSEGWGRGRHGDRGLERRSERNIARVDANRPIAPCGIQVAESRVVRQRVSAQ